MSIRSVPHPDLAESPLSSLPRRRPRPSQFLNGIDVWAFLAIEVVLLIILVNAPPPHQRPVDLSTVDHATSMRGAIREDAMHVTVTRDGNVFFNAHQVHRDQLIPQILDSVHRGSEAKVYLSVDARAKYGDATRVIDQVRQAGIQHIGIITNQHQPTPR